MSGPITDVSVGHLVRQHDDGMVIERLRVAQANKNFERISELLSWIESWGVKPRLLSNSTWSIEQKSGEDSSSKVEELLAARAAARAGKNFAESDRIRDELAAMGVVLKDGKDADGKPITTWEIAR